MELCIFGVKPTIKQIEGKNETGHVVRNPVFAIC